MVHSLLDIFARFTAKQLKKTFLVLKYNLNELLNLQMTYFTMNGVVASSKFAGQN